ncbi:c2h2 type zinc finger domain protein [Rutstroemia sp. NJR-2017a WRK4]|nr:c2h2 type zinc finger domain protein [Rutstroemia sp. NJR-2017a WRK4]
MSDNVHSSIRDVHPSFLPEDIAKESAKPDIVSPRRRKSHQPTPTTSFGCHQCPKSFNRRENLSRHMKTPELPSKTALLTLQFLDDVPRTHICDICEKTFTRSDLLKRHKAGHERWDKKERKSRERRGSAKRRKVSDDSVDSQATFQHYSWPNPTTRPQPMVLSPLSADPTQVTGFQVSPTAFNESDESQFSPARDPSRAGYLSKATDLSRRPQYESKRPDSTEFGYSHPKSNTFPQQLPQSFQDISMNTQIPSTYNVPHEYPPFVPYDFASNLQPASGHVNTEWFSNDVYSAMRETGNEWESSFGNELNASFLVGESRLKHNTAQEAKFRSAGEATSTGQALPPQTFRPPLVPQSTPQPQPTHSNDLGSSSTSLSMPNDTDEWPFLWSTSIQPAVMLEAEPINIPFDHPLSQQHNPRYDISESTYSKMRSFLTSPVEQVHDRKPLFSLPSLFVANIFIGLYFEHFSHQAPVLHHATVEINELPPPLLAAMMIVGASYSNVKNARRFAIVLIDIIGWHLLVAMNLDVSLVGNPMIIFTQALLIHMGLWCGNKHAFHVAEAFRGQFVSQMRRLYDSEKWKPRVTVGHSPIEGSSEDLQAQWLLWINQETLCRLHWVVYTIDRQFSALWNLPSTIAVGELADLGCPCDDVFWIASSARQWRNLLGSASSPPSISFSAAAGPFLLLYSLSYTGQSDDIRRQSPHLPVLDLNPYSAFLVMLAIQEQIFSFSQEYLIARNFLDDSIFSQTYAGLPGDQYSAASGSHTGRRQSSFYPIETPSQALRNAHIKRRREIASSLNLFSKTYLSRPPAPRHSTSHLFHSTSIVQHRLSTLLLHISPTDLLNVIGKAGQAGIDPAMERLVHWAREDPALAVDVAFKAAEAITEVHRGSGVGLRAGVDAAGNDMIDTAAYGATLLLMGYVILWVFAQVADEGQKARLMRRLEGLKGAEGGDLMGIMRGEMGFGGASDGGRQPRALFRSATEILMKFGTWGVALDMAMLLHRRAEGQ